MLTRFIRERITAKRCTYTGKLNIRGSICLITCYTKLDMRDSSGHQGWEVYCREYAERTHDDTNKHECPGNLRYGTVMPCHNAPLCITSEISDSV